MLSESFNLTYKGSTKLKMNRRFEHFKVVFSNFFKGVVNLGSLGFR